MMDDVIEDIIEAACEFGNISFILIAILIAVGAALATAASKGDEDHA